ncbi:hypothetical protein SKAU_G00187370 [Synaphobranchus kaupii]|uniref:Uncharacterized protein n=1 Tax=Synaphobranchus kaupii TaxID=118154 RepID=A0A9Q1IWX1_SYNKA|nr:hypothetical protein SKAU_G00187370 [Synaphobranchus kaupii]
MATLPDLDSGGRRREKGGGVARYLRGDRSAQQREVLQNALTQRPLCAALRRSCVLGFLAVLNLLGVQMRLGEERRGQQGARESRKTVGMGNGAGPGLRRDKVTGAMWLALIRIGPPRVPAARPPPARPSDSSASSAAAPGLTCEEAAGRVVMLSPCQSPITSCRSALISAL